MVRNSARHAGVHYVNRKNRSNMNTFFDESGALNLDELILNQPSFRKIMEDGVVTEDELTEQSQRIINLLKQMEQNMSAEQIDQVRKLLAEISVLVAARGIFEKQ